MVTRRGKRGFSLLVVVLILAVLAVVGAVLLDVVRTEQRQVGAYRLEHQARQAAEGGLAEVINDQNVANILPTFNQLQTNYTPSSDSAFDTPETEDRPAQTYQAQLSLIRVASPKETSKEIIGVFVYEVDVRATVGGGDATDQAQAEVFKPFARQAGTVLPSIHAR